MALPQKKEMNQPNLNTGLGSVANDNISSRPANDNAITQNMQMQSGIANRLAASRASESASRRMPQESEDYFGDAREDSDKPQNDNEPENFNDQNNNQEEDTSYQNQNDGEQQNQEAQQQEQQMQLDAEQQQQAAVSMNQRKQTMLAQIKKQVRELDKETSQLEKELGNFKQTKAKKFLSFLQPKITFMIEDMLEILKKQVNHLSYKARIAFLEAALTTIGAFIGMLKGFKFITCIIDAAFVDSKSCLKAVIKTIETIVIPIILIIISPLYIAFLAVLFYIGKIPLIKGAMTNDIIQMIEKLQKQQNAWKQQLSKLKPLVAKIDQKKNLQSQAKQLQKQDKS